MTTDYFILIFSISILLVLFFLQIFYKTFSDTFRFLVSKWIFIISVISIVFWYFYLTGLQYIVWTDAGPPSLFFLPPYTSIIYLLQYHFVRFLMYYCISFIIATLFIFYGRRYNKKFGNRFFEDEELLIGGSAVFLLGNPSWMYVWIFYLLAVLLIGIGGTFYLNRILKRAEDRFPFYYLWMPLAIVAIIISELVIRN